MEERRKCTRTMCDHHQGAFDECMCPREVTINDEGLCNQFVWKDDIDDGDYS